MTVCILTPYQLAFVGDDDNIELQLIDYILNTCFLIDIIVNCCSAYYNDNYDLIEDHKVSLNLSRNLNLSKNKFEILRLLCKFKAKFYK